MKRKSVDLIKKVGSNVGNKVKTNQNMVSDREKQRVESTKRSTHIKDQTLQDIKNSQ